MTGYQSSRSSNRFSASIATRFPDRDIADALDSRRQDLRFEARTGSPVLIPQSFLFFVRGESRAEGVGDQSVHFFEAEVVGAADSDEVLREGAVGPDSGVVG